MASLTITMTPPAVTTTTPRIWFTPIWNFDFERDPSNLGSNQHKHKHSEKTQSNYDKIITHRGTGAGYRWRITRGGRQRKLDQELRQMPRSGWQRPDQNGEAKRRQGLH